MPKQPEIALEYAEQTEWLGRNAERETERYARLAGELTREDDDLLVDAGCGAAGMAIALARARPAARVLALDADPRVIEFARGGIDRVGVAVATAVCDMDDLARLRSALDGPADLVWAAHAVHHSADQQAAVANLAALLAPGGRLALAEGGLGPRFLPWDLGVGRPGLEHRLTEAGSRRMEAENAERGAAPLDYGWNLVLERAGLTGVRALHLPIAREAPLTGDDLAAAIDVLSSRLRWFEDFLTSEDREAWKVLLDPADPRRLAARRDLYHLEFQTIHIGTKSDWART